jgi:hypothetical protein
MTLRPEYSLGHSEYNPFLFAAVGEEKVGTQLTVLTALTRLGFDPWREAARLSNLPRGNRSSGIRRDDCDASRRRLEGIGLGGDRDSSGELVAGAEPVGILSVEAAPIGGERMKSGFATWLAWGVLAVALLFLGLHLLGDNNLEFGRGAGVSTEQ